MNSLSIRAKVTILFVCLFLILSSLFSFFMYNYLSGILYQKEEETIEEEFSHIFSHLKISANGNNDSYTFEYLELLSPKTKLTLFDLKGNVRLGETDSRIAKFPIEADSSRRVEIDDQGLWFFYDKPIYYENKIIGWIRVSRSISPTVDTLKKIKTIIFTATPLFIFFATLSSLFLARRALAPIDSVTKTASEIEKGDLSRRIKIPITNDEIGRLARTFNKMIARLEDTFNREKRFTSDASHELRTPITVISAKAEAALTKSKKIEDYKKALRVIIRETKRVSFLLSQLLLLARSDEGKSILNIEKIDLKMIIESIIIEMKDKAEQKNIRLSITSEQNLIIKADQTFITMLFLNIIENSIKYNKKGGFINISFSKEDNNAKVIIEDSGIGISDENLIHIFDRFYRVSESRADKGSGLGLSIVKEIVEVHKGQIKIDSKLGKGTKFEISLPMNL
ncbi:MAG: HAMP domain-containing histidine kinase [Actinobacteria bacterium]|nr:HAMP domain-containing histidine kinase [Actinomycetota bacterium]